MDIIKENLHFENLIYGILSHCAEKKYIEEERIKFKKYVLTPFCVVNDNPFFVLSTK